MNNDGGTAFPALEKFEQYDSDKAGYVTVYHAAGGMTLRDYFAAAVQADDRLVKCIRAMDDTALEIFALHPTLERIEHITEVDLTNWHALPSEVAKVTRRLELEAHAAARVRYMQADAMIRAREAK